jgi:hypothetical protein
MPAENAPLEPAFTRKRLVCLREGNVPAGSLCSYRRPEHSTQLSRRTEPCANVKNAAPRLSKPAQEIRCAPGLFEGVVTGAAYGYARMGEKGPRSPLYDHNAPAASLDCCRYHSTVRRKPSANSTTGR